MRRNERDISFNVDAYTAKLIGRENVSKLEGALLDELRPKSWTREPTKGGAEIYGERIVQ